VQQELRLEQADLPEASKGTGTADFSSEGYWALGQSSVGPGKDCRQWRGHAGCQRHGVPRPLLSFRDGACTHGSPGSTWDPEWLVRDRGHVMAFPAPRPASSGHHDPSAPVSCQPSSQSTEQIQRCYLFHHTVK
jgi:hypothetical protein